MTINEMKLRDMLHDAILPLAKGVDRLEKEMKTVKADIKKLKKDSKTIVSFFDHKELSLETRVKRIESHLGL